MLKWTFARYKPLGLRLWHWLDAAVIVGLLLTVLVRQSFFRIRINTQLIQSKAQEAGTPISAKAAKDAAEAMVDNLWQWHIYLGYVLGVLLLTRILVLILHREYPLQRLLSAFRQYRTAQANERSQALHYALVATSYLTFYAALLFMVGSGLAMVYEDELNLPDRLNSALHETHHFLKWYFLAFISVHVVGVLWAELGKFRGLVSSMIHGGDRD